MPIERTPGNPVARNRVVPGSTSYKVRNGDTWESLARVNGLGVWDLIEANFRTRDPAEVNWYLHHYVGCKQTTQDGRNWLFSSSADPGLISIPRNAAIGYRVPGLIVPVRQPSGMSCWAAMYTMMYSWKNQVSLTIETAVSQLGQHYLDVYRNNTGLSILENRRMAEVAGMVAEPLQNWSVEGWAQMLRRYGLLWTSYAWRAGNRSGRHIIIFFGLRDGGAQGQLVLYVDPGDGQFHEMPFSQAVAQHELGFTGAPLADAELGQFSQVIHY